jgi:hypothetical protein
MRALISQQGLTARHEGSAGLCPRSRLGHFPGAGMHYYPSLFYLSNKDLFLIERSDDSFDLDIFNASWESISHIELQSRAFSSEVGSGIQDQYSGISHLELPQNNTKKLQTLSASQRH